MCRAVASDQMMTEMTDRDRATVPSRALLWLEFIVLFIAVPVAVAVVLPPSAMFTALFASTLLGVVLLHFTPGFRWRDLLAGRGSFSPVTLITFAAITAGISYAVLATTAPNAIFALFRANPELWLMIMLLYPLMSALPQEVVFRPLFFRRYGTILPEGRMALTLNAGLFSLAHLLYWNWIVALMTFAGGIVFAWAYEVRKSFPLAVVLHAIAGNVLFTLGMGVFFYSGNVVRPF
ncbi:CPBP family intramembrane glutamic endopeptidase [Celeribacter sp. PS-C1]|uniref:CPBP family intramembrane glutamic endopeptidase n=1 Tax=Celeribacter sp. PS-C1 TaxID=2820813 RepID=UPI00210229B4|nr:CPBP family intramembrane glutamic endopeptidase [Celeribacter sp. PS-C1]